MYGVVPRSEVHIHLSAKAIADPSPRFNTEPDQGESTVHHNQLSALIRREPNISAAHSRPTRRIARLAPFCGEEGRGIGCLGHGLGVNPGKTRTETSYGGHYLFWRHGCMSSSSVVGEVVRSSISPGLALVMSFLWESFSSWQPWLFRFRSPFTEGISRHLPSSDMVFRSAVLVW